MILNTAPVAEKKEMIASYDRSDLISKARYTIRSATSIIDAHTAWATRELFGVLYRVCRGFNPEKNRPSRAMACQDRALTSTGVLRFPKVESITGIKMRIAPALPIAAFMASAAMPRVCAIAAAGTWYRYAALTPRYRTSTPDIPRNSDSGRFLRG